MKVTDKQIIKALELNSGRISDTCRALGITRTSLCARIERDVNNCLKEAFEEIKENNLDFAESQLSQLIANGNLKAIIYYLNCMGKSRGWNNNININDGEPITIEVEFK